jgi:hypothetical protein
VVAPHSNGTIDNFADNGAAAYSGEGGPATSVELNNHTGVAVPSTGDTCGHCDTPITLSCRDQKIFWRQEFIASLPFLVIQLTKYRFRKHQTSSRERMREQKKQV